MKNKIYSDNHYMKYMFTECKNLKDLENRCLELAALYRDMREDKIKLIDSDGCYFWFSTTDKVKAEKYSLLEEGNN